MKPNRICPDEELKEPVRPFAATFSGAEMLLGYMDGLKADSPEPSENRSASYRHGFANGRDDLRGKPRDVADALRVLAEAARKDDEDRSR